VKTKGTLLEALGIEVVRSSAEEVAATMPVSERTVQPFGYLHGGATAALLETVASIGALESIDAETQTVFGVELHVHHKRSARSGTVTGIARPLESGADRQVWTVEARNEDGDLLSEGTCAVRVVAKVIEKP
jgi:uncharacterized protein (TIGR00369 family)